MNYVKSCFDITFVTFGNSFYTSPAEFTIIIVKISGVDCVNVSNFGTNFKYLNAEMMKLWIALQ